MICNIIDAIITSLSCKENWQMIIIPILAPVATIIGTYTLTTYKINRDQKSRKLENEKSLKNEKKDILDSIDLMVLLANQHLGSINSMKNGISFDVFKINSLAIFANEPLIFLNQIPKSKLDLIFDRHEIVEQEKLLVYGNFLTSRQLLLQLYKSLDAWNEQYRIKHEQLTANFSDALLNLLNYLEVISFDNHCNKKIKTLFTDFLNEHQQYTISARFKNESEITIVDSLVYSLVKKMKEDGFYFELEDFQKHYIKIESMIISIKSFCHNNQIFLSRIEEAINKQIEQMRIFDSTFEM